ncbi:MAG: alpha-amylase family glycosyl hydrolase [Ginsengibacter sp.]
MKIIFSFFICMFFAIISFAQQNEYKCYPSNWWTGMKLNNIQVMVHGENIADHFPMIKIGPEGKKLATGVYLTMISRVENPNYIFLDLRIDATAKAGKFSFPFLRDISLDYELKSRRNGKGKTFAQGVTSRDFIYLILPDRFSNGDPTNDRVAGMRDQSLNRDTVFNRHGGDLQGITSHLNYIQSLGVTTLWLNPVIENDMPDRTEHGYSFTDHYKIDPRIGGEAAYHRLIDSVHEKGMKIIQDAVYNHVGKYHFTVIDMPMKDWLHQWPTYTNTSYKDQTLFDPYVSETDRKKMSDGWFTTEMPDLNQQNPFVADFLIEHAIWTVEEFGIDGWRIDTYPYNDLNFMNRCNKALTDEYPQITMFGETWVHGVPNQSYFVQNNYSIPFKSNLQASADFQTLWALTDAMTKDFGWTDGVNNLYTTLAQDFVYKDPTRNVIFFDNHDIARFFSVIGEDVEKYKSSIAWLLTCRGIPQLYYGDELGLTGFTSPNDGHVRQDFPGGWPGDSLNKFSIAGRNAQEENIWRYIAKLAGFRKASSALTTGKMMQYAPAGGIYVYFRYDNSQTVMVVMNTAKESKNVSPKDYFERTAGFSKMKNVLSGDITGLYDFSVTARGSGVYELLK